MSRPAISASLRVGSMVFTASLLLLWTWIAHKRWVSPVFLPAPIDALRALWDGMVQGELASRTLLTVERMFYGWVLASIAGVAIGALIGLSATARGWLLPTLELLRPLPASSLIPVGIALVGLTNGMVVSAIVFGAVWPVLLACVHGFSDIHPRLHEVARVLRMGRVAFAWKFGLPNALPDILAGMRLSLTASLIVSIVGEMLSAQEGLGTTVLLAARSFRASELYAGVFMLGLIGFISNWLLEQVENRVLRWRIS
ncbi:MAG TPA: ABC transporter permease [Burkholderiaceae bacterium]|nr:ABC transporter permease [Burkholderiaceae bacterium]